MPSKWDARFIQLADFVAAWSTDQGRKVGAVIVARENIVVSTGYNGLVRGVAETEVRTARDQIGTKYLWAEHAERNAIYNAARLGVPLEGCTLYTKLFPCSDCARAIIQSGITTLVTPSLSGHPSDSFYASCIVALEMLEESQVQTFKH